MMVVTFAVCWFVYTEANGITSDDYCSCLLDEHRLLFTSLLCLMVQRENDVVSEEEMLLFIKGWLTNEI